MSDSVALPDDRPDPRDYRGLPEGLPVPIDDGAADGLVGSSLPDLALPSTLGGSGAAA